MHRQEEIMSLPSQEGYAVPFKKHANAGRQKTAGQLRSVHPCDFRAAGRLSNETARALTALHEEFARQLIGALDAYLGIELVIKLLTLDQLPIKEHTAAIPALSYIVPFSLGTMPGNVIMVFDIGLVFPIIELLLGGTGTSAAGDRELSEIEEEIMQDVVSLIARQAESAWQMPHMSLVANRRIESEDVPEYCPPNDKVTKAKFEIEVAGTVGNFEIVFPSSFVASLIKQSKLDKPQSKSGLRYFPTAGIRERILDCDVVVAAGVPRMKVAVRDLIALQPGCVLKLRAPVRVPGVLTAEGMEMFEAMPVRNGSQKAAQLVRRVQPTGWGRE
jgi:flagellar motor switch protein FliM